jgi:hypothetical protein
MSWLGGTEFHNSSSDRSLAIRCHRAKYRQTEAGEREAQDH